MQAKPAKVYLLFLAEVLLLEEVLFLAEVLLLFLLLLFVLLDLVLLEEVLRLLLAEEAEVLFLELRFSIILISFQIGSLDGLRHKLVCPLNRSVIHDRKDIHPYGYGIFYNAREAAAGQSL